MALTRAFLGGMQLTGEQISAIIEAHTESTDALKAQRDEYKAQLEKLNGVDAELKALKKSTEGSDEWQKKYEAEHKAFEEYKVEQTTKETKAAKENAYKSLLKENGIREKSIEAILKVTDLSSIELDEKGAIKDAKEISKGIKTEWSDFITTTQTSGAQTQTPPDNANQSITKEQFAKMSYNERLKMYNENPDGYKALTSN